MVEYCFYRFEVSSFFNVPFGSSFTLPLQFCFYLYQLAFKQMSIEMMQQSI